MAQKPLSKMEQINEGLRRLYALKEKEYDDVFKERCEENGFEEDDGIDEEINAPMEESQLADDDFLEGMCPWIKSEGDDRREEIFGIIKECYKSDKAYTSKADMAAPLKVSQSHFDVDKSALEYATKIAKEQAPAVFDAGFANDEVLCTMLAVAHKTGKNYLLFLVDMFLRETVYHHWKHKDNAVVPNFETAEWNKRNNHLKELHNINIPGSNKNAGEMASAAVKSYLHRVAPKVMLKSPNRIIGSLEDICSYIYQTVCYVHVMSQEHGTCPFQYDSVYTFTKTAAEDNKSDEEDDDDDDDEDDNQDVDTGGPADSKIGNIKTLLENNKLKHVQSSWGAADRQYRALDQGRKELKGQLKDENKNFPQFHRFVSIVDLRDDQKDDDQKAKLYVFEPKKDAAKIHKNPSALNFFHNSKESIIPNPDVADDGVDAKDSEILTATSTGPQVTLSFHVESEESMRCYFYIHGQCTRFMPADMKMLLPLFFEDSDANRKFAEGKVIMEWINDMETKLRDDAFRAFLKDNGVQSPGLE